MKRCFRALNLALMVLLAIQPVFAQIKKSADASLRITVVDPNGEAIPNARVLIAKQTQEAITGLRGEAVFSQLAVGKTQIVVNAEGFAPMTIKDFNLKPGANQIEVRLQIATVEETVRR